MNWTRISALILRYNYLFRRNLARLLDVIFWPVVELIVWGFVSMYLIRSGGNVPLFVAFFLGAFMFWEIIYRANLGISVGFLEDMWSRNFLNLFASPLKSIEFLTALVLSSLIRTVIGFGVMVAVAGALYGFNIFTLGLPLIAFFMNVMIFGWALGVISAGIILHFGQGSEMIAWAFVFVFQPLSAVFYPVAILPVWLQHITRFVPASHVFEGLRTVISTGIFSWPDFWWATGLNVIYISVAVAFFFFIFKRARASGRLAKQWQ